MLAALAKSEVAALSKTKQPRQLVKSPPGSHLLLHLLDLADEASARLPVVVAQQVDVEVSGLAELLLLLLLRVLQFALGANALAVVHVVGLHHL